MSRGIATIALFMSTLVTHAPAHAGECVPTSLRPRLVTPEGATLPPGGGLLVVEGDGDEPLAAPTGAVAAWRFVDGKRRVAPTARVIAPGMTVLAPVGARLDDAAKRTIRRFRRGAKAGAPLAAPAIKRVEALRSRQGYRVSSWIRVELEAPAPAGRYLVVFDAKSAVARSFGIAQPGATSVSVYRAGECTVLPDGTLPTTAGDAIQLAWVDLTGRMSPLSAAVTVTSPDVGPIAP